MEYKTIGDTKRRHIKVFISPVTGEILLQEVDIYFFNYYISGGDILEYIGKDGIVLTEDEVLKGKQVVDYKLKENVKFIDVGVNRVPVRERGN